MRSLVTSKNVSWPRLIWPTLYIEATDKHEASCLDNRTILLENCSIATLFEQIAWADWVSFDTKWTGYGVSW